MLAMRSRPLTIMLVLAAAFLLLGLVGYLARDPIATAATGFVVDRQEKLSCTHPDVHVAPTLDQVVLSPVDCKVRQNPITEFSSQSPMIVDLRGMKPHQVRVAKATIDQRERDISGVESNVLGELADMTGSTDSMVKAMLDASESYSRDDMWLVIDELTAKRGGKKESVMHRFRTNLDGEWNRTRSDLIDSGSDVMSVGDLDMRVTRSRGHVTVSMFLGKREPGDEPDFRLEMIGERLDSPKPKIRLRLL
jgi:hypothetical protein